MNVSTKIFTRILILCYLAVSSIAAVHAFPAIDVMSSANIDKVSIMVDDASITDQADCHQAMATSDSDASGVCKIFCSATGHALTTEISSDVATFIPLVQIPTLSDGLVTRQLSVEHQPPK